MYALHDPEGGIFYAKPVQDNLPAYFLDWLEAFPERADRTCCICVWKRVVTQ